jgi:hypothetical protein
MAGTIGQIAADVPIGLSLTHRKKRQKWPWYQVFPLLTSRFGAFLSVKAVTSSLTLKEAEDSLPCLQSLLLK